MVLFHSICDSSMLLDIASLFNCRFIYATIGPSIWLNNAAINTLLHVLGNTHTHTHTHISIGCISGGGIVCCFQVVVQICFLYESPLTSHVDIVSI